MEESNPVSTPMNPSEKLTNDVQLSSEEKQEMQKVPYQEALGCLLYLAHCTRPDCFNPFGRVFLY